MLNWFYISLVAPILWSVVNHIDKHILSRFQDGRGIGAILIFSALSSIVILPFILFFYHSQIFSISLLGFFTLISVGFLTATAFYFYLKAMDIEEASVIIPLFQFDAIFGYFLGYFILNEALNIYQILSSILILIGIVTLSSEIDLDNKIKFKKKAFSFVAISSFLFALSGVLFKSTSSINNFWVSIFWQYLGLTLFGILVLLFFKKYRENFTSMFKARNYSIFSLNILSELLYMVGGLANNFAILIAPVALVFVVNSYQPLFVFISGILLTIFFPKFVSEKITRKHLLHKFASIIIITIGSYLLYLTSN